MTNIRLVSPGKNGSVINEYGVAERPPEHWSFLPAGDAAITRKVTAQNQYWKVQIKKGKRTISKGIWAPDHIIESAKKDIADMRSSPDYQKKRESQKKYRQLKEEKYALEFQQSVAQHLNFDLKHKTIETRMAKLITDHAIPVGSGTVARTTMIPLGERASRAVNAWMRHQTTAYDTMQIARVKGERRNVRKQLAGVTNQLLDRYRRGESIPPNCPLLNALNPSQVL